MLRLIVRLLSQATDINEKKNNFECVNSWFFNKLILVLINSARKVQITVLLKLHIKSSFIA